MKRELGLLAVVCLGVSGCKLKLDAQLTGYKPGSSSVVLVHVKGQSNAYLTCSSSGLECGSTSLPGTGETDVEIDLGGANASKKPRVIYFQLQAGPRRAQATVSLEDGKLPPKIEVSSAGYLTCIARDCSGSVTIFPSGSLTVTAAAGTKVELGTETFTVDPSGSLTAPAQIAGLTPVKDVTLTKLCGKEASPLGSAPLALTFPDGVRAATDLSLTTETATSGVCSALSPIAQGAVRFPWEKPDLRALKRRAALYVTPSTCAAGGPADATVSEIAVVVVADHKERVDQCEYDLSESGSGKSRGSATGKITLNDLAARAYDRLTGKKLGEKLFAAPKECDPHFKISENGSIPDQTSYVSGEAVARWGATLR